MKSNEIDWERVKKVLVVRLRSIGDTVLSTPSLIALRRFLPNAQIDILLEDWVAPVLENFHSIDNVIKVEKNSTSRYKTAWQIRRNQYDAVFNFHGGTTSTFFTRATGAKHRIGFSNYQYSFLYNHLLSSSADFWQRPKTHSAEQQLALLGYVGIPVQDRPKSSLDVSPNTRNEIEELLRSKGFAKQNIALIHPAAAFETKQWKIENFAQIIDFLAEKNIASIVVASPKEEKIVKALAEKTKSYFQGLTDLSLPQVTALASVADLFVGNDSGIAHIAAAVQTPSVVIFGSSNRSHWSPWTNAPHEIVFEEFPCQPCAGYFCEQFDQPRCILSVKVESVKNAIEKIIV